MNDPQALERRLARLQAAMGPRAAGRAARKAERAERRAQRRSQRGPASAIVLALAFVAAAIATGKNGLLVPGLVFAIIGAVRLLSTALSHKGADPTKPHIGMGADVAAGAVVEPGAVVEMGAEIREGAIVRSGAVVRMGCDVKARAVIESGAVIGWGCDIGEDAVVEAGAVIGAGATVKKGARVPAGMRVAPGATFASNGLSATAAAAKPEVKDERRARIESSCARIEAELEQLPPTFREHLGATGQTAGELRTTCLTLLDRERALRGEASQQSLDFLDTEAAELEKRIAAATDDSVKRSLASAVAAIADQKKQRLALKTHADRIEAEVTRMQWTLDGMATQLVRLRATGTQAASAPSGEVMQTVQQLHEEIDAITVALEEVAKGDSPMLTPISDVSGGDATSAPSGERVR